jgi:hypothetical protein
MFRKSLGLATAIALAGLGSIGITQPAPMVQMNAPRQAKRGLFGGLMFAMPATYGRKGAGISMAQQQRTSRKVRNVKRHRAAMKG